VGYTLLAYPPSPAVFKCSQSYRLSFFATHSTWYVEVDRM